MHLHPAPCDVIEMDLRCALQGDPGGAAASAALALSVYASLVPSEM